MRSVKFSHYNNPVTTKWHIFEDGSRKSYCGQIKNRTAVSQNKELRTSNTVYGHKPQDVLEAQDQKLGRLCKNCKKRMLKAYEKGGKVEQTAKL